MSVWRLVIKEVKWHHTCTSSVIIRSRLRSVYTGCDGVNICNIWIMLYVNSNLICLSQIKQSPVTRLILSFLYNVCLQMPNHHRSSVPWTLLQRRMSGAAPPTLAGTSRLPPTTLKKRFDTLQNKVYSMRDAVIFIMSIKYWKIVENVQVSVTFQKLEQKDVWN